jgi:hypothetical protein
MRRRAILLHKDHPALLRARCKYARWGGRERGLYRSHRMRVEGVHGEAKPWHGLARAVRRGLANMQIQAFPAAAVINLKRMAAAILIALLATVAIGTAKAVSQTRPAPIRKPAAASGATPTQARLEAFFNGPASRVSAIRKQ